MYNGRTWKVQDFNEIKPFLEYTAFMKKRVVNLGVFFLYRSVLFLVVLFILYLVKFCDIVLPKSFIKS